jgi:hypothetical protein
MGCPPTLPHGRFLASDPARSEGKNSGCARVSCAGRESNPHAPRGAAGEAGRRVQSPQVAVFVDGAFWHGHPSKYWLGRSGGYWDAKIARNQERDRRVDAELGELGWSVLRLWDFEVEADPDEAAARVGRPIGSRKDRSEAS